MTFYNLDVMIEPRDFDEIASAGLVETVMYDTVEGTDADAHLDKVEAVTDIMYETDGYYARTFGTNATAPVPPGQTRWVAVNFWRDAKTVDEANPVISGSATGQDQIADIAFNLDAGGLSPTLTNFELRSHR